MIDTCGYKLKHFIDQIATMPRDRFIEKYPHPFLIVLREEEVSDENLSIKATMKLDPKESFYDNHAISPDDKVYPAKKRMGANHFSKMIMIGRTEQCDILIPTLEVSKFHASINKVIALDSSVNYHLSDGKSCNGTLLNGRLLKQDTLYELNNNDIISLGETSVLWFHLPDKFYDLLNK